MLDHFICCFSNSKGFYNLWEGSTHVVPISSSVKCTLHQRLAVHEWLDVFLCIVQSERLEQIKMDGVISEVLISNVTIH